MDASAQPNPWFVREADKQLVVPLTPKQVETLKSLPYPVRGQVGDNLNRYLDQLGDDYGPKENKA